jgi:hypothetical protein
MSRTTLRDLAATPSGELFHGSPDDGVEAMLAQQAISRHHAEAPTTAAYCALEAWCEGSENEYGL